MFLFSTDQNSVTWSLIGGGVIYQNGIYIAPSNIGSTTIIAVGDNSGVSTISVPTRGFIKESAFQRNYGYTATATGVAGSTTNLYLSSSANDNNGIPHWLIRNRQNNIWATIDDFALASDQTSSALSIASSDGINIFVSGLANDNSGTTHSIVRLFNGSNWSTIDNYQYVNSQNSQSNYIQTLSNNLVIVAGSGNDASGIQHWLVRSWNGTTWTILDDYITNLNSSASANTIISNSDESFMVASGKSNEDNNSAWYWLTRIYQSNTWTTSDKFQLSSGFESNAKSSAMISATEIYSAGYANDSSSISHWIVRQFDGTSWNTIDDYQYPSGGSAQALNILAVSSNEIYICGTAKDSANVDHWIIRKWNGQFWSTIDDVSNGGVCNFLTKDNSDIIYGAGSNFFNGSSIQSILLRNMK